MKKHVKFYVEPQSFWVKSAVVIMGLSLIFRLLGTWGLWTDRYFAYTQILLPAATNLLYIVCLMLLGKRAFWVTSLPMVLGVAFFIIKSLTFDSILHTVLCILLYALVFILYGGTAFGLIRTKWLLVPLFALPFIYHIFVEDMAAMRAGEVSFASGLQEMSVLCIMLSLLCVAFALKKKQPEEKNDIELPKIKDPIVIVPEKKTETDVNEET